MDPHPAPRTSRHGDDQTRRLLLLRMIQEIVDSGGPDAPIAAVGELTGPLATQRSREA